MRRRALPALLLASPASLLARPAPAQERPLRLVIAWPPGGSTDALGRMLAPPLAARLGREVVPENRSGAAGAIGAALVAQAPADGTALLLDSGGHATNPWLMRGLPFDYLAAFAPVALLATLPLLLVVRAGHPAADAAALAALRPEAYASVGVGSRTHLAAAAWARRGGFSATHVPFRGGAEQVTALLRGDVPFAFASVALAAPHLEAGRLRALGASAAGTPWPALGLDIKDWLGLHAPAATPPALVARQAEAALAALAEVAPRLPPLGMAADGRGPAGFAAFLAADRAAMGALLRAEGIEAG
ncbi:tripartite tricarboxylate transporter substrate-binding protein [Roseococcus sp. DSY-14]|uniref:tripartite tricarboxylate transporter substrate-binding protein n=1 Tax=Roseococcus sp. DSY-14 TaxID=3369650 RepID=UPI00387B7362